MNVNEKPSTSKCTACLDVDLADEVHNLGENEISAWIDRELAQLEVKNSDFVTHDSLRRHLKGTDRSARSH